MRRLPILWSVILGSALSTHAAATPSAKLVAEFDDYSDGMAFAGGNVYVTNVYDNSVLVVDAATATAGVKIKVGRAPMRVTTDGTAVYVVNQYAQDDGDAYVSVVDTQSNTVTQSLGVSEKQQGSDPNNYPTTGFPADAALVNGQLFVSFPTNAAPDIMPIDVGSWDEHPLFNAGSGPWHLHGAGNKLIVTNERAIGGFQGAVMEYGLDGTLVKDFETGQEPREVASSGTKAFVTLGHADGSGGLVVIDSVALTFQEIPVGKNPRGLTVVGDNVYIACQDSQRLDIYSIEANKVTGSIDLSALTGGARAVAVAPGGKIFVKTQMIPANSRTPHARVYAVTQE